MSGIEELVIAAGELTAAIELVRDGAEAAYSAVHSAYENVVSLFSPIFPTRVVGSYKDPVTAVSHWMCCYISPLLLSRALGKILSCDPTDKVMRGIIYNELDTITSNNVWIYGDRFPDAVTLVPTFAIGYREYVSAMYSELSTIAMYSKLTNPPSTPYSQSIKIYSDNLDVLIKNASTGHGFLDRTAIEVLPGMIWKSKI